MTLLRDRSTISAGIVFVIPKHPRIPSAIDCVYGQFYRGSAVQQSAAQSFSTVWIWVNYGVAGGPRGTDSLLLSFLLNIHSTAIQSMDKVENDQLLYLCKKLVHCSCHKCLCKCPVSEFSEESIKGWESCPLISL